MVPDSADLGGFRYYEPGRPGDLLHAAVPFPGRRHRRERNGLDYLWEEVSGFLSGGLSGLLPGGRLFMEKILEYAGGENSAVRPVLGVRIPACEWIA